MDIVEKISKKQKKIEETKNWIKKQRITIESQSNTRNKSSKKLEMICFLNIFVVTSSERDTNFCTNDLEEALEHYESIIVH